MSGLSGPQESRLLTDALAALAGLSRETPETTSATPATSAQVTAALRKLAAQ